MKTGEENRIIVVEKMVFKFGREFSRLNISYVEVQMVKIDDLSKIAILVDFDGTITTADTNDELIRIHMNDRIESLWKKYRNDGIDLLSLMELQVKEVKITEEEYINFILNEFHISEGFVEFYKKVKEEDIPFAVISGGFDNGIIPFLKKHGIDDADVYANSFVFNDDSISVKFYDEGNFDCCENGPCGNCKIRHYKDYKEKRDKVIFIGDGFTDKCVSEVADIVFAKDYWITVRKNI